MNFIKIVKHAWKAYDNTRQIHRVADISAMVSTNHVYKIRLKDGENIIAKLSYFGKYEHFVQDHTIINVLSNNLPVEYENFLSRALMVKDQIFFHRYIDDEVDAWVVFYRPIKIRHRLPARLDEKHIAQLGKAFAKFHKACHLIRHTLPHPSKDMTVDMIALLKEVDRKFKPYAEDIRQHCDLFLNNTHRINYFGFDKIPVFVDWNIGNFSLTASGKFFSRWDYDWFRMSSRIVDFYFISRVVSDVGDKTSFTYNCSTLMEDRFILFLKHYHKVFPLSRPEVLFIKEAYRFFLLNYVVREGQYFFRTEFAKQLQHDVFIHHLRSMDAIFDEERLLRALDL